MVSYGQYCPIAKSAEIIGDRWTLLIIREMMFDVHRFNEFHRGLPGISRSVLVDRLRRLEESGVLERRGGEYFLTPAGEELREVVVVLGKWGARWILTDPTPRDTDPDLLMLFISRHIHFDKLPPGRTVVGFELTVGRRTRRYWLVLEHDDVSLCFKYPGFDADLTVVGDAAELFRVYMGRTTFDRAVRKGHVELHGPRRLASSFPGWMKWSHFAERARHAPTHAVAAE